MNRFAGPNGHRSSGPGIQMPGNPSDGGPFTPSRRESSDASAQQRPASRISYEDFQRLGVRQHEFRLTVIRRAAARSSKRLAKRQLAQPSDQNDVQLTRIATSTYRLMDPRNRADSQQRVHVGRILPNALSFAARTRFSVGDDDGTEQKATKPFQLNTIADNDPCDAIELATGLDLDNHLTQSLTSDDILQRGWFLNQWLRFKASRAAVPLGIAVAVLLAANAITWFKGSDSPEAVTTASVDSIKPAAPPEAQTAPDPSISELAPAPEKLAPEKLAPEKLAPEILAPETSVVETLAQEVVETPALDDPTTIMVDTTTGLPEVPAKPLTESPSSVDIADTEPSLVKPPLPVELEPGEPSPSLPVSPTTVASESVPNATTTPDPLEREPEVTEPSVPEPKAMANAPVDNDISAPFLDDPFALDSTPSSSKPAGSETAASGSPDSAKTKTPIAPVPGLDVITEQRDRIIGLIPKLSRPIAIEDIEPTLDQLVDLESELEAGSADFWVIRSMIAEVTWLTGDCDDVIASLQPLTDRYDAELHSVLAQSYIASPKFIESEAAHQHRLASGLNLCDRILIWEQFDQVDQILHAIQPSIDFFGDPQRNIAAKQIREACKQMRRLRDSASPVLEHPGDPDVTESAAGITGRYLCLMRRQWNNGLTFLAKGTDARLSNLAQQELDLGAIPSAKELSDLGNRWIAMAARTDGRAGDSIRLHAISLYQQALLSADPLMKLELQRVIEAERKNLPPHMNATAAQPLS